MADVPATNARSLTQEEIGLLPRRFAVALAVRCAWRVQPITGYQGAPDSWHNSTLDYHLAIQAAIMAAALMAIGNSTKTRLQSAKVAVSSAETALSSKGPSKILYSVNCVVATVSAAQIIGGNGFEVVEEVARAIASGSAACPEQQVIHQLARQDFEWLKSQSNKENLSYADISVLKNLFERPLWLGHSVPLQDELTGWQRNLLSSGLDYIYNRYQRILSGEELDWDGARRWLIEWEKSWWDKRSDQSSEEASSIEESAARPQEESPRKNPSSRPAENAPLIFSKLPSQEKEPLESQKKEESKPKESAKPMAEPKLFEDGFTPSAMGDQPSKRDHLGREKLARVLAAMFTSKAQGTPFTVAILGDWGSGKSTLMELIKNELNAPGRKGGFAIAEFNAWEYEHTDNIRAGLAQEVVNGLTKDISWFKRWGMVWQYAKMEHRKDLIRILVGLIAVVLASISTGYALAYWAQNPYVKAVMGTGVGVGIITFLVTAGKNLKSIIDHPLSTEFATYLKLPSYGQHLGQVPVIKRQLKSLCGIRLSTDEKAEHDERRLVVFVDDLDRCHTRCITETLDAIRLVMNIRGVIVVIMIDHRIAMKAVAEQYASLADGARDSYAIARDYLGKIIQVPITLLPPQPNRLNEFVDKALFPSAKSKYVLDDTPVTPTHPDQPPAQNAQSGQSALPGASPNTVPTVATANPAGGTGSVAAPLPEKPVQQVVEEQKRIEKEMEDTTDDRDFFKQLVDLFDFNNPRQLVRMRNSFRMIKGIERENDGKQVKADRARQLMLMLFWLEFLNDLPKEDRRLMQAQLDGKAVPLAEEANEQSGAVEGSGTTHAEPALPEDMIEQAKKIRALAERVFDTKELDGGIFNKTAAFVTRFVLPFQEGVLPKLDAQAESPINRPTIVPSAELNRSVQVPG